MTPQDRADKSAEALWEDDNAARWFGASLKACGEGWAEMELTVQPHHCNGHGILHGGVTFGFADTTFAYACNSRNVPTVAAHCNISFLRPGRVGDVLTARAEERQLNGRSGIYDMTVTNQDGTVLAEMRGMSRAIKGQLFDEGEAS